MKFRSFVVLLIATITGSTSHAAIEDSLRAKLAQIYLEKRTGLLDDETIVSDTFSESYDNPAREQIFSYSRSGNHIELKACTKTFLRECDLYEATRLAKVVSNGYKNAHKCHCTARVARDVSLHIEDCIVTFDLDEPADKELLQAIAQSAAKNQTLLQKIRIKIITLLGGHL